MIWCRQGWHEAAGLEPAGLVETAPPAEPAAAAGAGCGWCAHRWWALVRCRRATDQTLVYPKVSMCVAQQNSVFSWSSIFFKKKIKRQPPQLPLLINQNLNA